MEPKYKEIEVILSFPMPGLSQSWKEPVTWERLIATKAILPTDIVHDIQFVAHVSDCLGYDELETYYTPTVFVKRKRLETPNEFLARRQQEEADKELAKESRLRQYLSLKAEFESKTQ